MIEEITVKKPQKVEQVTSWPGSPYPLGATYDGIGVNFALFAEHAEAVDLCLFDDSGAETKIPVKDRTHNNWHIYMPGLKPGQQYGYRVHGIFDPNAGQRFNPNKLLIDPYAYSINGTIKWSDALFPYVIGNKDEDLSYSTTDSATNIPKSVVIDKVFDWQGDSLLRIPLHKTVIYEMHVKGFTQLANHIPEALRGTYAGISHPESLNYFKKLGINAVELMPIHHFVADRHLVDRGLTNYWGYNSIAFFAPDARYASTGTNQVAEFKQMVRTLHKAGIEVILDVVYNHTAEGNHMGPMLSFRGIDNISYYRLLDENKRYYKDYTGTGNTLNTIHPTVLRLIMDSLRYWVVDMHVDGFRFDLATVLAREFHDVDKWGSFFDVLHQDPVLSQVKLIAEPWDVGENGFHVGNFPAEWMEWNAKYRDCMREYWKGDNATLPEFANRFTGSSDLYLDNWRTPVASINFITAHDGFTLRDLVSYNEKHNEANGDDNKDGENNNRSYNYGVEGPTEDAEINNIRKRQVLNFLTTLFLSQGVPMLVAGDELGRTQQGNNNAYCQDNEISWIDWNNKDEKLLEFTSSLINFRLSHPAFCRNKWFQHKSIKGIKDIEWFVPEGTPMNDKSWNESLAKSLGIFLSGSNMDLKNEHGEKIVDDSFYIIFNSNSDPVTYKLPDASWGDSWSKILDTSESFFDYSSDEFHVEPNSNIEASGRSVILLVNRQKEK